ncbi:MAG: hypothetical protein QM667_12505 [Asticcacaulis sp.]
MTGLYELNCLPHRIAITCPRCETLAEFEFATLRHIQRKADIPYFKTKKAFDYRQYRDGCGHRWHAALYYPGLHGPTQSGIDDVPDDYTPGDWAQSPYWRYNPGHGEGSVSCSSCGLNVKHRLSWPGDLYFQVAYRGQLLWAFDRGSAMALRDFLASKTRNAFAHGYSRFLLHIPTVFKHAKAREAVVRALDKKLRPNTRDTGPRKGLSFTAARR